MTAKKTFPLGKGTGNTAANLQAGPHGAKSASPGKGFKMGTGTGKALHGNDSVKKSVPTRVGYKNSNGTGKALSGQTPPGGKSTPPGKGYSMPAGTGKALHGMSAPHKGPVAEDTHKMGKGTGHALRGKEGGHKKVGATKTWPQMQTNKKSPAASTNTSSTKAAPYGLHDDSSALKGLRHYSSDASPLGIKNVDDIKNFAKKLNGKGGVKV